MGSALLTSKYSPEAWLCELLRLVMHIAYIPIPQRWDPNIRWRSQLILTGTRMGQAYSAYQAGNTLYNIVNLLRGGRRTVWYVQVKLEYCYEISAKSTIYTRPSKGFASSNAMVMCVQ